MLGHAYAPVLEALETAGARPTCYAGASAGAIAAGLAATGRSAAEIASIQHGTPWARFAGYRFGAVYRLLLRGGWHSIDYARDWLEAQFGAETFGELYARRGVSLLVAITRYRLAGGDRGAEPFILGPVTTPGTRIAAGILASMAVPVFWPPVEVDLGERGKWWAADGGIVVNHPVTELLQPFASPARPAGYPLETVLGIRVDLSREIVAAAPEPYRPTLRDVVAANAAMMRRLANESHIPAELWKRIIRIDVGNLDPLDFGMPEARIWQLRAAGVVAVQKWDPSGNPG